MLGGGPAGLAFAALAARSGARALVVERSRYDRSRPGEHLAGAIRPALAALGVDRAAARPALEESAGILVDWGATGPLVKGYGGRANGPAFNADRLGFDRLLRDAAVAAGAACVAGARLVEAAHAPRGGWRLRVADEAGAREVAAGLVVDASGRRAGFARRQGARQIRVGELVAVTAWHAGAPGRPGAQPLVVAAGGPGWWSLAATPGDGWAASFFTAARLLRRSRLPGARWTAEAPPPAPLVAKRLAGAAALGRQVFACWPQLTLPAAGPGWIAVGEAAVAFDPICGQGVARALATAFRAWEAAAGPGLARLGPLYGAALRDQHAEHLAARAAVYAEAGPRLDPEFLAAIGLSAGP